MRGVAATRKPLDRDAGSAAQLRTAPPAFPGCQVATRTPTKRAESRLRYRRSAHCPRARAPVQRGANHRET